MPALRADHRTKGVKGMGKAMTKPGWHAIHFKPGKLLREQVNNRGMSDLQPEPKKGHLTRTNR